jgi:hypothetical protein
MVSECANPHCNAQFLYFGQGQLVAVPRRAKFSNQSKVEFFWLCGDCANFLEIQVTPDGGTDVVERPVAREL